MIKDIDIKSLQLLGEGTQGKVYKIDSKWCIKIFKNKEVCKAELETLVMSQNDNHFPRLYKAGEKYIIRECINGIELDKYLSTHKLTHDISHKIIELYEAMKKIGFKRLDAAIFHIFITPTGELKLIDTAKAMKKSTIIPHLIISGLEKLGYKEEFLNYVKSTRRDLYINWIKYSKKNYTKKRSKIFNKGDFHIHSTASDGELSPNDVVLTAKQRGVDIIAITDHNTMAGVPEAVETGRKHGVSVIPAVELSTKYRGASVHILGYFKDNRYTDNTFKLILKLLENHQFSRARSILGKIMNIKTSGSNLSVLEGINLLKFFGASIVLAHPVRINKDHLLEIINLPFDGIEAKYCHTSHCDTCFFAHTALARFSFYTCGSDFHTDKRNDLKHCNIGEPYLNSSEIERFLKKSGVMVLS